MHTVLTTLFLIIFFYLEFIITLFLPFLSSLQTITYTLLCCLSHSWPLLLLFVVVKMCVCVRAHAHTRAHLCFPKCINTTCLVFFYYCMYVFSAGHLVLDN